MTTERDADTEAFFKELEKDDKHEYLKCSVSQTFDAVFQCYSNVNVGMSLWISDWSFVFLFSTALGAQALNYYRYGEKKDCSEKWEDFKLCLWTKPKSNEEADVRVALRVL